MVNRLFHISEEDNICEFAPKKSIKQWEHKAYVWALNEDKLHNYLLPRDCSRICVNTSSENPMHLLDIENAHNAKAVIFVSKDWENRIKDAKLFRYEFNPENFKLIDKIAGYYVSEQTEIPINKIEIDNCSKTINALNVKFELVENKELAQIREIVAQNFKDYSIIRWRNFK